MLAIYALLVMVYRGPLPQERGFPVYLCYVCGYQWDRSVLYISKKGLTGRSLFGEHEYVNWVNLGRSL